MPPRSGLPPRLWLLATQLCVCVALLGSAALYVHYLDPADSDFCGLRSGCEAVRRSGLSYFFGSAYISLPLFSVLAQLLLLLLSLRRGGARAAALQQGGLGALWALPEVTLFAAAGLGGMLALGLIGYQALVLGQYCWLCLVVDISVALAALSALGWARAVHGQPSLPESPLSAPTWLCIALLLVAAPPLWNQVRPEPPVPRAIEALYVPGKINVVEFADFECPYCRRLHAMLRPLLAEYGERVAFRRLQRPLDQHPHAEQAARAALCAEAQGKGEAMADRLFTIELSPESISAAAEALRLDPARYDACMDAAETTATLEQHAALLPDEQFKGLPTTYVGGTVILGVPTETALRDALERTLRPRRASLSGPVYVVLVGLLLGFLCWFGRRRAPAADVH
jgi:predicted DsbA family dithiol-disulfide isomerase